MTPAETFGQLPASRQRQVHLSLCEHALMHWKNHVSTHAPLRYTDSVVGMRHEVDVGLPADALRAARAGVDSMSVESRYQEPIAAMQDTDLSFLASVEFRTAVVRNLDGWYDAFGIKPGDALYLAPDKRVRIW